MFPSSCFFLKVIPMNNSMYLLTDNVYTKFFFFRTTEGPQSNSHLYAHPESRQDVNFSCHQKTAVVLMRSFIYTLFSSFSPIPNNFKPTCIYPCFQEVDNRGATKRLVPVLSIKHAGTAILISFLLLAKKTFKLTQLSACRKKPKQF